MVRIISCKTRTKEDGTNFYLLEVQEGGIEMVLSKTTGQYYATAKRAAISTTFDELTCKGLVGEEMGGRIVKVPTEPYAYTIKETGKEIMLEHRYSYLPDGVSTEEEKLSLELKKPYPIRLSLKKQSKI
ncbi:hypothetical protein B0A69_00890 [Chryseobacterium shigense]|uniref:Uncharacterized protein n=1 Tax=Chryseobacterium shigense TaxID=297244 RepID=A0A1N7JET8_9FLAO|nr:hypothetical protein [Chryseobacterium shigense]PQA97195.1 hypothetical protein B0A69_00890 [Chryseobacterium shigense]SIS47873.1 hypothetical protein SAMN05421639_106124 [Chryseobacterium shigense]